MTAKCRFRFLFAALVLTALPMHADDGAAAIAAGGIIAMRRETRIVMSKEVLKISIDSVDVDYDFRNDSDQDVETTVAFPVPDYSFDPVESDPKHQGFDDFKLWVAGEPAKFAIEARAFLAGKDDTQQLTALGVDVASFGHFASKAGAFPDIQRLPKASQSRLVADGLISQHDHFPLWTVRKKYYWQQRFPAHATVHIRHEYTPNVGGTNSILYAFQQADRNSVAQIDSLCPSDDLRRTLSKIADGKDLDAPPTWVDFILTTANTWKTPIEDFTLIVQRPHLKWAPTSYVSFCWDGPITKLDADHFSAHAINFVPKHELRVGFFDVSKRVY